MAGYKEGREKEEDYQTATNETFPATNSEETDARTDMTNANRVARVCVCEVAAKSAPYITDSHGKSKRSSNVLML